MITCGDCLDLPLLKRLLLGARVLQAGVQHPTTCLGCSCLPAADAPHPGVLTLLRPGGCRGLAAHDLSGSGLFSLGAASGGTLGEMSPDRGLSCGHVVVSGS